MYPTHTHTPFNLTRPSNSSLTLPICGTSRVCETPSLFDDELGPPLSLSPLGDLPLGQRSRFGEVRRYAIQNFGCVDNPFPFRLENRVSLN